jgi:hypothetical protein
VLLTQYILRSYRASDRAPQVSVQIQFEMHNCGCHCQNSVIMYLYENLITTVGELRMPPTHIVRLTPLHLDGRTINLTTDIRFLTNTPGFHIAIKDESSCMVLKRMIVFFHICPRGHGDLVMRDEVLAPAIQRISRPLVIEGRCVEGASPVSGDVVILHCNQGGVWSAIPGYGCTCNNPMFTASANGQSCVGK